MPLRDPFIAIADPTRREMIDLLARKELTVNILSLHFKVSRPAISRHLRILRQCGVVTVVNKGREKYCYIEFESLEVVSHWLEKFK